jgi:hypothetical protein
LKLSRRIKGGPSPLGTHQRLPPTNPQTKYGPFPPPWFCCHGLDGTVGRSDSRSALAHFTVTRLIGHDCSWSTRRMALCGSHCQGGDGSLLFSLRLCQRSTPLTPLGSSELHIQELHSFHGLRLSIPGSAPS